MEQIIILSEGFFILSGDEGDGFKKYETKFSQNHPLPGDCLGVTFHSSLCKQLFITDSHFLLVIRMIKIMEDFFFLLQKKKCDKSKKQR